MRATALVVCLVVSSSTSGADLSFLDAGIQEALKYRKARAIGGIYKGKIRPFYVDNDLFLQPIDVETRGRPGCASRSLLRLDDDQSSLALRNKFDILVSSWAAGREVVLIGKGTCSIQGDELIFAVIPR